MLRLVGYESKIAGEKLVAVADSRGGHATEGNLDVLLDCLNTDYSYRAAGQYELKFTWDIDVLFAHLSRLMSLAELRAVRDLDNHSANRIRYIPGKMLRITGPSHTSYIYHLSQFYREGTHPPHNVNALELMGRDILDIYRDHLHIPVRTFASPIAAYRNAIYPHLGLCSVADIPAASMEVIEYAENVLDSHGEWVETYKVGHWGPGDSNTYDITAAYPAQAARMYDLRNATFTKSKKSIPCTEGYLHGRITIYPDTRVHPISYLNADGYYEYPTGSWDTWISYHDAYWLCRQKLGSFELYDGWFVNYRSRFQPLKRPLEQLFNARRLSPAANYLCKRIAAGVWGSMIQGRHTQQNNDYYNPLWAGHVLALNRLEVADFIYRNSLVDKLICVQTDSITAEGVSQVDIPLQTASMGEWKLADNTEPLISLSRGRIYRPGKHPGGLYYPDLVKLIKTNPGGSYYRTRTRRTVTMNDVLSGIYDLGELGLEREFDTSLNLNIVALEKDRLYKDFPATGQALLDGKYPSLPLAVSG